MRTKLIIAVIVIAIVGGIFLILKTDNKSTATQSQNSPTTENQSREEKLLADKVEVFLFHTTNRCISCITIGKYAGETVEEYFQTELEEGKIEFREINIDLPENKALASKFQASGSSLYLNAITNDTDNIEENTRVWRLISNETQFKTYLKGEINSLLGK